MEIKDQLLTLVNIIMRPKRTLINLPSDKFYLVGFLISAYFSIGNIARGGGLSNTISITHSKWIAYAFYFFICAIFFVITAFIIKLIIRIFGKQLTLNKVMNIIGYSQTPRLILSLPASIIVALLPFDSKLELFSRMTEGGMAGGLTIGFSLLGGLLLLYSLFLLIWGFIISKGR